MKTIAEFIEELKKYPPDTELVFCPPPDYERYKASSIDYLASVGTLEINLSIKVF